jgi:hypothetical protein
VIRLYGGSVRDVVTSIVPLPPVVQRATDDVALRVTNADGHSAVRYYRSGMSAYLLARYALPTSESGLLWQVERTEG